LNQFAKLESNCSPNPAELLPDWSIACRPKRKHQAEQFFELGEQAVAVKRGK
jgi:hypothetical protein